MAKQEPGWALPLGAAKTHFFVAGRSLCGKWGYFSVTSPDPAKDERLCKECQRALIKGARRGDG